jgi:hypothetical protein
MASDNTESEAAESQVEAILSSRQSFDLRVDRQLFLSGHANQRSVERFISLGEIDAAVSYGTKEPAEGGGWKFTFAGVVVIVDDSLTFVLTVWPEPGYGIDLHKVRITPEMWAEHTRAVRKLRDKATWTSHKVAVVDQSGSMRNIDIDKHVTRSDLVWLTLAVSVANLLKSGDRSSTDVLSVVAMRESGEIVLKYQPYDWILYNHLIDLMQRSKPSNGGFYFPALDAAESLLSVNRNRNCALALFFLSDGRPSDKMKRGDVGGYEYIMTRYSKERIGRLARCFGKRLQVCAAAIGDPHKDEFRVMKGMIDEAKQYECPAVFQPACLSAGALEKTMMTMTSTTTTTMTTISEVAGGSGDDELTLRDFEKQPQREVGQSGELTHSWEFVQMKETATPGSWKRMRSIVRTHWVDGDGWIPLPTDKMFHTQEAKGVAFETRWFGEGKERLVKEFREVGPNLKSFVGPPLVAKASMYLRKGEHQDSKDFHKAFCKTQLKAWRVAKKFNEALERIPSVDDSIPRIEFLDCSVYMLETVNGRKGYLVERMLDIKKFEYQKFNDNAGRVFGRKNRPGVKFLIANAAMGTIEEGDEDDEDDEDNNVFVGGIPDIVTISAEEIPQAFSCFSHKLSKRNSLICDLQGILNTDRKPFPVFELTDPVIHSNRTDSCKKREFGRTDRGLDGILDFFKTHECSDLCRMLQSRRLSKEVLEGRQNLFRQYAAFPRVNLRQRALPSESSFGGPATKA